MTLQVMQVVMCIWGPLQKYSYYSLSTRVTRNRPGFRSYAEFDQNLLCVCIRAVSMYVFSWEVETKIGFTVGVECVILDSFFMHSHMYRVLSC